MAVTTQSTHPWRATLRTIVAAVVGFIVVAPLLVEVGGLSTVPGVASALVVTGAITRILANPTIEAYLRAFFPVLAAGVDDAKDFGEPWDVEGDEEDDLP